MTTTAETKRNPYQEQGFNSRKDYLVNLAEENGVDVQTVFTLASLLGPDEDFDGLVTEIQDLSGYL